ncbi:hypothetical protein [Streptococcus hyovaginalis]|nr:hypothetical protein [Streptococcus hyovaginalis]
MKKGSTEVGSFFIWHVYGEISFNNVMGLTSSQLPLESIFSF